MNPLEGPIVVHVAGGVVTSLLAAEERGTIEWIESKTTRLGRTASGL